MLNEYAQNERKKIQRATLSISLNDKKNDAFAIWCVRDMLKCQWKLVSHQHISTSILLQLTTIYSFNGLPGCFELRNLCWSCSIWAEFHAKNRAKNFIDIHVICVYLFFYFCVPFFSEQITFVVIWFYTLPRSNIIIMNFQAFFLKYYFVSNGSRLLPGESKCYSCWCKKPRSRKIWINSRLKKIAFIILIVNQIKSFNGNNWWNDAWTYNR